MAYHRIVYAVAAHQRGYTQTLCHFNSIFNYLEDPAMTPILRALIRTSSLPLWAIETHFAPDSSGFTTSQYTRWHDIKYRGTQEHGWVKPHPMCGVRTHIVTDVEIGDRNAADAPYLPSLLATTAQHFNVQAVSADKGYSSVNNINAIYAIGAIPYIPFKSNASAARGGLWAKAYHYYHLHRDEFLEHYHQRSNVETVFEMIKRKLRREVRSKTEIAMANEVYCKILCTTFTVSS
jgi:transposase